MLDGVLRDMLVILLRLLWFVRWDLLLLLLRLSQSNVIANIGHGRHRPPWPFHSVACRFRLTREPFKVSGVASGISTQHGALCSGKVLQSNSLKKFQNENIRANCKLEDVLRSISEEEYRVFFDDFIFSPKCGIAAFKWLAAEFRPP